MILPYQVTIDGYIIKLSDNINSTRFQENPNKYNFNQSNTVCFIDGCPNTYMRTRTSGLCNFHRNHCHDLLLEVFDSNGYAHSVPAHKDIIDSLMNWAITRNFSLDSFFSKLSFNILGNIPDVTSLSGDIFYQRQITMPTLNDIFSSLLPIIHEFFPPNNSSSYQKLNTNGKNISAITLAYIIVGLLICEETNRGDRWFFRNIIGDESRTKILGAAMPLAYYATKTFQWGVEMPKRVSRNLTR